MANTAERRAPVEGALTCEKVPSGYTITRHGKYGSMQFFLIKNQEELEQVIVNLSELLNKDIQDGE